MKNLVVFFLFIVIVSPQVVAQNNFCNFTLDVREGVKMNKEYVTSEFKFNGVKPKHEQKLLKLLDIYSGKVVETSLSFFQKEYAAVCRFKSFELVRIFISQAKNTLTKDQTVNVDFFYQKIVKDSKSKGQAAWVKR